MPKYQVDFQLYGTIYVEADNEALAKAKMEAYASSGSVIEFPEDLKLDGNDFISCALTSYGLEPNIQECE